jgi:leucyl-tRNA synthetase
MERYNPKNIEEKWQKHWQESGAFEARENSEKPKYYILDMFPYPSGAGLHMGHIENFTATDILARYQRMRGLNVLRPMGWDAFGLPAENYAIKTGVHPATTTVEAIQNFTRQITRMGLSYDWSREISTATPEYYKWTQWFFLLLYENGLAYKKKAKVNWCSKDQTVLANEQVVDGACERCGTAVIQKDLEQWFFKITDFAEDLINDLDSVDWPSHTVTNQRNWIGKSEGAEIDFKIAGTNERVRVFTTRPDTLFGATYIVLAPEHELVETLKGQVENWDEVSVYVEQARNRTDMERSEEGREKTGVRLEGVSAVNPANNEEIPVFIADYVLAHYGTGAIMAVPAHDERDFEFAETHGIKIQQVIKPNYLLPYDKLRSYFPYGIDNAHLDAESFEQGIERNRQATIGAIQEKIRSNGCGWTGPGTLINSGTFDGMESAEAKRAITERVGGEMKTTYRLRDWLVSRQRYWGCPIPVVYDPQGNAHPVPEEHLPWTLPTDVEFRPDGASPLALSKELKERTETIFGEGWTPEVDTMDTFVDSSWYFFRFTDPKNEKEFASKEVAEKWMPVDLYMGGAEHTVLHLMYARFFTKVLQKLGYISFGEPFAKLRHQGMILGEDNFKMSKSRGNVVNPDELVEAYGADTARLYVMFMGPLEDMKPWNSKNISGAHRFLGRVWGLVEQLQKGEGEVHPVRDREGSQREPVSNGTSTEVLRKQHATIKKVTEDIQELGYNTAIAALMEYVNTLYTNPYGKAQVETLVVLLAPFAPHIAEELWEIIGNEGSVHGQEWPSYDEAFLVSDTVTIPVQVNGRVRAQLEVPVSMSEEELKEKALAEENVQKYLEGNNPKKVIVIPGKMVSVVV